MNIFINVPFIIKEKYKFIMYLLTCSLNSKSSYFKTCSKPEHKTKITHISNKKIQNRKYDINVRAVDK
jgi:hypothetical protein